MEAVFFACLKFNNPTLRGRAKKPIGVLTPTKIIIGGGSCASKDNIGTAIFAITTISYDEFDNGLAFLMTLPVTRKQYVAEKYLLGAGLTAAAWGIEAITGVICKGVAELQGCLSEKIIGTLIYIPLALLMLAVSLPLVIHFGAEKGRYIAMVMWAIIFAVVYILIKTMGLSADAVDAWLNGLNRGMVLAGVVLFTVIVYMGSFWIGVRLMEKKEF